MNYAKENEYAYCYECYYDGRSSFWLCRDAEAK
jgi:hypothetical protein